MSDIFVVFPPLTTDECVLFAKNSDRPPTEVQEVVHYPAADHADGSKLHCTFIEIEQVGHTHATILSKPAWAWGAEMGANDHGVCIGSTAVWTRECHPGDHEERLLGCDFVRLGLERGKTARDALDVITGLLTNHGQGGLCCEDHNFGQWTYHNAYIICDNQGAWLLETAGKHWAAKQYKCKIAVDQMFSLLRDEASSVNFIGELLTVGSQVSVLAPPTSCIPACHWFTATPNASISVFKPFIFCDSVNIGNWTRSPAFGDRVRATFQTSVDRRHALYKAHEKGRSLMESGSDIGQKLCGTMRGMEQQCVHEVTEFLKTFTESDIQEVKGLFGDLAESEAKFYY